MDKNHHMYWGHYDNFDRYMQIDEADKGRATKVSKDWMPAVQAVGHVHLNGARCYNLFYQKMRDRLPSFVDKSVGDVEYIKPLLVNLAPETRKGLETGFDGIEQMVSERKRQGVIMAMTQLRNALERGVERKSGNHLNESGLHITVEQELTRISPEARAKACEEIKFHTHLDKQLMYAAVYFLADDTETGKTTIKPENKISTCRKKLENIEADWPHGLQLTYKFEDLVTNVVKAFSILESQIRLLSDQWKSMFYCKDLVETVKQLCNKYWNSFRPNIRDWAKQVWREPKMTVDALTLADKGLKKNSETWINFLSSLSDSLAGEKATVDEVSQNLFPNLQRFAFDMIRDLWFILKWMSIRSLPDVPDYVKNWKQTVAYIDGTALGSEQRLLIGYISAYFEKVQIYQKPENDRECV